MFTLGPNINDTGYTGLYGNWQSESLIPLMFQGNDGINKPVVLGDGLVPAIPITERYTNTFSLPAPTHDMEVISYFKFRPSPTNVTLLQMYAVYTDISNRNWITRTEYLGNVCAFGTYEYVQDNRIPSSWKLNNRGAFEFFVPMDNSLVGKSVMAFRPLIGTNDDGTQQTSCWLKRQANLTVEVYWAKRNPDDQNMVVNNVPFRIMLPTSYDATELNDELGNLDNFKQQYQQEMQTVSNNAADAKQTAQTAQQEADRALKTAESTYNTIQSRFAVR